jgi:hypothetical protein
MNTFFLFFERIPVLDSSRKRGFSFVYLRNMEMDPTEKKIPEAFPIENMDCIIRDGAY